MDGAVATDIVDGDGGLEVNVTNIPTGPSNVVQRLLAFTAGGGATFYQVPSTMTINDNTTTSVTLDFTDSILLSGVSLDYLFSQIELPQQIGVTAYTERLFWWGERSNIDNFRNLTFDGGWDGAEMEGRWAGRSIRRSEPGRGANRWSACGDAFRITGDGVTVERGYISQSARPNSLLNNRVSSHCAKSTVTVTSACASQKLASQACNRN